MNQEQVNAVKQVIALMSGNQLFPPDPAEVNRAIGTVASFLRPARRAIRPLRGQLSIDDLTP